MKKFTLTMAVMLGVVLAATAQTLPWSAAGGPDSYGYTWKTSDDPTGPTFGWVDIINNNLGTEVIGLSDDNSSGFYDIGFEFQYYWVTHTEVCIGSNGYIHLGGSVCATISSGVDGVSGFPPMPTGPTGNGPGEPNDIIAPFMADLTFTQGNNATTPNPGRVFYYSDLVNKQFVVTYENVPFWVSAATSPNEYAGVNTFQVILNGADSTITFQYLIIQGDWEATYNNSTYPFVTGIENTSGSIGLMVPNLPVNTAQKPTNGTAITFSPPVTPLISFADIGIKSVQNATRSGFFVPWPQTGVVNNFPLRALVSNDGNANVTADILVQATVTDTNLIGTPGTFLFAFDTVKGGLDIGEVAEVKFTLPFNPPRSGPFNYNVRVVNTNSIGDLNSTNDTRTAELVAVDTTQAEAVFDYTRDDFVALFGSTFPTNFGYVNWTNNNDDSGLGAFIKPFSYPVTITAVEMVLGDLNVFLTNPGCTASEGAIMQIHAAVPNSNLPGELLYSKKVPLADINVAIPISWTRIPVDSVITIDSLGFYISFLQDDACIVLIEESGVLGPFSNQTYEILAGSWANYRNASNSEGLIRAVVNLNQAVTTDIEPQLDNLNRFTVYPNPNRGRFTVDLALDHPSNVELRVMDVNGRKVSHQFLKQISTYQQELDFTHLSAGIYFLQLTTDQGAEARRIVIE